MSIKYLVMFMFLNAFVSCEASRAIATSNDNVSETTDELVAQAEIRTALNALVRSRAAALAKTKGQHTGLTLSSIAHLKAIHSDLNDENPTAKCLEKLTTIFTKEAQAEQRKKPSFLQS